jgi:hypothetical protein
VTFPYGGVSEVDADAVLDVPAEVSGVVNGTVDGSFSIVNNATDNDTFSFAFDDMPEGWGTTFSDGNGTLADGNLTLAPRPSSPSPW